MNRIFHAAGVTLAGTSKGNNRDQGKARTHSTQKGRDKKHRLIDAALVGGKTTLDALAQKPGIQASLDAVKMSLATGQPETHEVIDTVNKNAIKIVALLDAKGACIKRLAVDGVPGSGKSTLARALAEKLKFELQTLDYIDLNKPQDFDKEKTIFEHHRLLRTQDLENFDALIYIDEPVELSKGKCIHRKRGGINIDIFDYEKLKRIGVKAFEMADGEVFSVPNSDIKMKMRPQNGFRAYENIKAEVAGHGSDISDCSKEELLFMAVYGVPKKGLMAYVKAGAFNKELLEGLRAGVQRFFMS